MFLINRASGKSLHPAAILFLLTAILGVSACGINGAGTPTEAAARKPGTIMPPAAIKIPTLAPTAKLTVTKTSTPAITFTPIGASPATRPYSGKILDLEMDPKNSSTLYAGTFGGVYKSTNSGEYWVDQGNGLPNCEVADIEVDPLSPTTLYAGTTEETTISKGDCGAWKSIDGGDHWIGINNGLPASFIHSLVIYPAAPDVLYLAMYDGLFTSEDGGENWDPITTLPSGNDFELTIGAAAPYTLYAWSHQKGLFVSNDDGLTWKKSSSDPSDEGISVLAVNPMNPNILFAGSSGAMYKSMNGGESWTDINHGLPDHAIVALAIVPITPATVYAVCASLFGNGWTTEVYKSMDEGLNWSMVNTGFENRAFSVLAIDPENPATLYAGGCTAVFLKARPAAKSGPRPASDWPTPMSLLWRSIRRIQTLSTREFPLPMKGVAFLKPWMAEGIGLPSFRILRHIYL